MDLDKLMADARSRDFHPVPLPVKLKAEMVSKIRPFESNNVIGILPGTDAALKDEAVSLYCALRSSREYVRISPETTSTTELTTMRPDAEFFWKWQMLSRRACRSRAAQSCLPRLRRKSKVCSARNIWESIRRFRRGKIALDLNFDDIPPLGAPQEVEVSGSERTTFFPVVHALAMEFRLNIRPDAHPEAGYYYRSDHFSLARVGHSFVLSFTGREIQRS